MNGRSDGTYARSGYQGCFLLVKKIILFHTIFFQTHKRCQNPFLQLKITRFNTSTSTHTLHMNLCLLHLKYKSIRQSVGLGKSRLGLGKDAFKNMMKSSAVMFSFPSQACTQTVHLDSNYSVSRVDSGIVDPSYGTGVAHWCGTTKIKKDMTMEGVIMRRSLVQGWIDNNFVTLICLFIEKTILWAEFYKATRL